MLSDPRIFNYIIMTLFAAAAVRWAFAGSWQQTLYWAASVLLTITVTFKD